MEIIVKKVRSGAEYEDKIANFWILGQLKDSSRIWIFDQKAYDLRKHLNSSVECLILAFLVNIIQKDYKTDSKESITNIISGNFIKSALITSEWKLPWNYKEKPFAGINTNNGEFLLDWADLKTIPIRDNIEIKFQELDELKLYVERFDLVAWHPIK